MSTETASTETVVNISTSMDEPKDLISQEEFDRLFEAEEKALNGDKKDLRSVTKEIEGKFTPEATSEPAKAPVEPKQGQEAAPAQGDESTTAWLDSLDPAIKANVEKLMQDKLAAEQAREQYIRSNDGRIAAEQRKARQLEQELQKERQRIAALSKAPPTQPAPAGNEDEDAALLRALEEADPALYKVLDRNRKALEAANAKLVELESTFEVQQKTLEERQITAEMDRLGMIVSNYQEIWDSEAYQWYMENEAPRSVQRAAATPTAEGAAQAIFAYGQWIQAQQQQTAQPGSPATTTATPPTNTPNPAAVEQAQRVQQERERKAATQPVASTTTARPSAAPTDTLADILSDPKKTQEFHDQVFQQELKRLGLRG